MKLGQLTRYRLIGWTAIVAAEAVFFSVLVDFWAEGSVHLAIIRKSPIAAILPQVLTDVVDSDRIPPRYSRHLPSTKYLFRMVRIRDITHQDIPVHFDHHRLNRHIGWCWSQGLRSQWK